METKASVRDSFAFGWNTFKQRPGILIGGPVLLLAVTYAILFVVMMVAGVAGFGALLAGGASKENLMPLILGGGALFIAALVIAIVVCTLSMMGLISFFLKAHDSVAGVALRDLVRTKPFWKFLGAYILVNIVTQIGMSLFVIPGLIAAILLAFVPYLILDKGLGVFASFKESFTIVKDNFLTVVLLALAIIALNIVGALLLLVGLLVTMPVSMLAMAHAYRMMSAHPVVAQAPAPAPMMP